MNLDEVVRQYVPTRPPYVDNIVSETLIAMSVGKSSSLAKVTNIIDAFPEPLTVEGFGKR